MTLNEWKTAMMYEATQLGHAEARTMVREAAARALVKDGKLRCMGTIGGVKLKNGAPACWYKLAVSK